MSSKEHTIEPSSATRPDLGPGKSAENTRGTILFVVFALCNVVLYGHLLCTIGRLSERISVLETHNTGLCVRCGKDTAARDPSLSGDGPIENMSSVKGDKGPISELTSSQNGRHSREKRSRWLTGKDEIRIVNPTTGETNAVEGVVEVKKFGFWGRICDKDWGMAEARVVCRQRGYRAALDFYRKAEKRFGIGPRTASRWLSDVQCAGNEATLAECALNAGIGVCASRRRWTAGVKCQDSDGCSSAPCKNGGTCTGGVHNYMCNCAPGWGGRNCTEGMGYNTASLPDFSKISATVSFPAVHIRARTDAMSPFAEIQVTDEKFTQWENMEEPQFALENGELRVTEEGRYLVYSQVGVNDDQHDAAFQYSVLVGKTPFLTCVSSAEGNPPHYTCYTAGVYYLRPDDVISLMVECDRCEVSTAEDTTFFGVIKLSGNLKIN